MSRSRAIAVAGVLLAACGGDSGETGIDLTIRYDAELGLDRFALTASAGGEQLVARTLLPETDRPLSESGREGVIVLVPDDPSGGEVTVRVDGMAKGDVVASGQVSVRVARGELVAAEVDVRPGAVECLAWDWSPSNFAPCEDGPAPDGALLLDRAGVYAMDSETGRVATPDGETILPASDLVEQAGGPTVRLVAVDELLVDQDAVLEVTGRYPVILAVWGGATIAGAVVASAGPADAGDCVRAGAGGDAGGDASGAGGGGGGAYAGDGGDGGDGHGDEKGSKGAKGRAAGEPTLVPLRGGCPGGLGGDAFGAAGSGGTGGRGGGAIQIAARDMLLVSGAVRAAGGGGGGGVAVSGSGSGAGGGGSGGAIFVESLAIHLGGGASLCANGGAGGEGAGGSDDGAGGAAGTCSEDRAATDDQASDGGDGGQGSAGDQAAGENGKAGAESGAGGGGGGGIGRVRLRAVDDLTDLGALVTPEAN